MVKRASWLSITPEPERELPAAVATMALGQVAPVQAVGAERSRIERLVRRGNQRRWLAYLHRVTELIDARAGTRDPAVVSARRRALTVISNHHNLLLGLAGPGAQLTAEDRRARARLLASESALVDLPDEPPAKGPR
jgi:hypothetical protein